MRLVSLVPSVTEILFELGLGDQVVGVSHQCRYPPAAAQKPVLTRSRVHLERDSRLNAASSAAIDHAYARFRARQGSPYALDEGLLASLAPDVIFDQGLCDVCAIGEAEVGAAARALPRPPAIVTLTASTVGEILESVSTIGAAAGAEAAAAALRRALAARIDLVRTKLRAAPERPRVVCLEWLDPLWCAGHWLPELVDLAGGEDVLGQRGAPSQRITWERVLAAAPDVLLLVPCSFSISRTLREAPALMRRPGWQALPAVQRGRVWVADSGAFSHHSHRTIDGLEMLAHVLHPDRFVHRWSAAELLRIADPADPGGGREGVPA